MDFTVEVDDAGKFRIVSPDHKAGEWAGYQSIATMKWNGVDIFAVSPYFEGTLKPLTPYVFTETAKVK